MRSTREVLESHLALREQGDLEGDLGRNYADDVVLLSWGEGVHRGKDGVRELATVLRTYLPEGEYSYGLLLVADEYGLLQWSGSGAGTVVHDGADSFVVRDGRIVAQTIHYATDRAAEP
jgi:hypothetical protein